MILDQNTLLSDKQLLNADGEVSTNVLDLGETGTPSYSSDGSPIPLKRKIGNAGQDIPLLIQVVEDFNNCTSVQFVIEASDDATFAGATEEVALSKVYPVAELKAGKIIEDLRRLPVIEYRYVRYFVNIVGAAPTTGKVTAGIVGAVA